MFIKKGTLADAFLAIGFWLSYTCEEEVPPPYVGGMVVRRGGEKGETRAARNRFRQRHFTARRPCFPLSLIRRRAPFRERSERNLQRMKIVNRKFCLKRM